MDKKLLRIAIQSVKREMQSIAFEARCGEIFEHASPSQKNALKHYKELEQVLRSLEEEMEHA